MAYNPNIHQRRSIRLARYDYSQPGMYYVTIRTKGGECFLGDVVRGVMQLSEMGTIVDRCWEEIPDHFPHVELDTYLVMPNHVHGIIRILDLPPENQNAGSPRKDLINQIHTKENVRKDWPLMKDPKTTLGKIVRAFKAEATKKIRDTGLIRFGWHGRYYDHIIRDGKDLDRIRQYILDNPANWENDENYPENIRMDRMHEGEDLLREITVMGSTTEF